MATIKTKQIEKFFINPNGNEDELTTSTRYTVYYNEYKKYYYLDITPCSITNWGYSSSLSDWLDYYVVMCPVKRKNAKVQRMCEDWYERNAEQINDAFLANGMDGVKEYFTKHWLAV